ncbi:MAG: hypothetical protein FWH43_04400 [Endomicrobia bacterium]|nr:hypothetical protein [Endomicrobiia bacterium]
MSKYATIKSMEKLGKTIIRDGAYPEKHELETAWFLNSCGKDIEFLVPVRSKGIRTPDIVMDGVLWEIKCPTGHGKRTLDRAVKKAIHQSQNIIFDLRRLQFNEEIATKQLNKDFSSVKSIRRLMIITKSKNLLDIKK